MIAFFISTDEENAPKKCNQSERSISEVAYHWTILKR